MAQTFHYYSYKKENNNNNNFNIFILFGIIDKNHQSFEERQVHFNQNNQQIHYDNGMSV